MPTTVIVGGGLASARVVKAYREAGGEDRLRLISADTAVPYHRPPLSKRYLRGEIEADGTFVEPESFYREQQVELELDTRVTRLDADVRELELAGGERVGYDRLVIASGAAPRALGVAGEELDGVFFLRRLADSTAIREAARSAVRALVVGAGFIGLEVAASLRALDVEVALVHRGDGLFDQLRVPAFSAYLADLYRERGVELLLGDEIAEFRGGSALEGALTRNGRELEAELAVVGVGVAPSVDFLEGSAIELANGVVVDERFRASLPEMFAVGDVAQFYDPVFERFRRIEHWSNASYQGTELGKLLAGGDGGYDVVSTFFTELFGTSYKVFGDPTVHDALHLDGSFAEGKAVAFYLDGGRVTAALLTGQDEEAEGRLKELIQARGPLSASR